jgi:hypothetical protein
LQHFTTTANAKERFRVSWYAKGSRIWPLTTPQASCAASEEKNFPYAALNAQRTCPPETKPSLHSQSNVGVTGNEIGVYAQAQMVGRWRGLEDKGCCSSPLPLLWALNPAADAERTRRPAVPSGFWPVRLSCNLTCPAGPYLGCCLAAHRNPCKSLHCSVQKGRWPSHTVHVKTLMQSRETYSTVHQLS